MKKIYIFSLTHLFEQNLLHPPYGNFIYEIFTYETFIYEIMYRNGTFSHMKL